MKKKLFILTVFLMVYAVNVWSLETGMQYVTLGYGRGWWGWACVVEQGLSGVHGYPVNFCGARDCPFEAATVLGENNCIDKDYMDFTLYNEKSFASFGSQTRITIPEDLKLVSSDGYVIEDEICVGDSFSFTKGALKGEYYDEGGNGDTPDIYWVDDVEGIALKLMEYHDQNTLSCADVMGQKVDDGYVDPFTGIPVYEQPASEVVGRLVCSLKGGDIELQGLQNTGDTYTASSPGTVNFKASYSVECMYYQYGGPGACMDLGSEVGEGEFITLRLPMVIQTRPLQEGETSYIMYENIHPGIRETVMEVPPMAPDAPIYNCYAHNVIFNSIEDFFKIGVIDISKDISVVEPGKAGMDVSLGSGDLAPGEANDVRVIVENTGDVDIRVLDVYSDLDLRLVSCDMEVIPAGESGECLVSVVPGPGGLLSASVKYGYKVCGRNEVSTKTVANGELKILEPVEIGQAYSTDVKGCEKDNRYYGCNSVGEGEPLYAGYKCYQTRSNYNTPTGERFNLRFDLSELPSERSLMGARLYLHASSVDTRQDIEVYGIDGNEWKVVDCVAGGDICTQPYCPECSVVYEMKGSVVGGQEVVVPGTYSIDVSDYVNSVYGTGGFVSLQVRGTENVWSRQGSASCSVPEGWETQHAEFASSGSFAPYLELIFASGE